MTRMPVSREKENVIVTQSSVAVKAIDSLIINFSVYYGTMTTITKENGT